MTIYWLSEAPLLDLSRSSWPPASDTGLDRHPVRRACLLLCTYEHPGCSWGFVRVPLACLTGWLSWRYSGGLVASAGLSRIEHDLFRHHVLKPHFLLLCLTSSVVLAIHALKSPEPQGNPERGISTRSCRVPVGSCSAPPPTHLSTHWWCLARPRSLHLSQRAFDGLLLKSARVRSAGSIARLESSLPSRKTGSLGDAGAEKMDWKPRVMESIGQGVVRERDRVDARGIEMGRGQSVKRERGSGGHRAPSVSGRSSLFNPWLAQVAHLSLSLCPHRQAHAGYHSSPLAHRIGRQHSSSCLIGRCDPCLIKTAAANHAMERTQEPSSAKGRLSRPGWSRQIWKNPVASTETWGWSVEDRILMEGGFRYELRSSRRGKRRGGSCLFDRSCTYSLLYSDRHF